MPFVAVGAERATFTGFDLSSVVPAATLDAPGRGHVEEPAGLVPPTVGDPEGVTTTRLQPAARVAAATSGVEATRGMDRTRRGRTHPPGWELWVSETAGTPLRRRRRSDSAPRVG